MSQLNGWVKVHRRIREKAFYRDSQYVHLWVHLILRANHKDNEFMLNGKKVICKRGSFYTSRKQLSIETGINENKIERILKYFKSEHQIEQQSFSFNRLITIVSYGEFAESEHQIEQQMNSKRTANEQHLNTNKNEYNDKNEKKENIVVSDQPFTDNKNNPWGMPLTENELKTLPLSDWPERERNRCADLYLVLLYQQWFTSSQADPRLKGLQPIIQWGQDRKNLKTALRYYPLDEQIEMMEVFFTLGALVGEDKGRSPMYRKCVEHSWSLSIFYSRDSQQALKKAIQTLKN